MMIPGSISEEHAHLHEVLERATREDGALGMAARDVMEVLYPHFEKEEAFALPPLGMLTLIKERSEEDIKGVIGLTDKLAEEIPQMMEEHAVIGRALHVLSQMAEEAGRMEYVDFCQDLMHHARMEEEVLYPASIMVGTYLRLLREREGMANP
jgi:hypothetical protein